MEQGQTWMKPDLILEAGEFVLGVAVGIGICGLLISGELGQASAAPRPTPVVVAKGKTDEQRQWLEERIEFLERHLAALDQAASDGRRA